MVPVHVELTSSGGDTERESHKPTPGRVVTSREARACNSTGRAKRREKTPLQVVTRMAFLSDTCAETSRSQTTTPAEGTAGMETQGGSRA